MVTHFDGLVFSTAVMYERRLRLEREDLRQVLRFRVWIAIRAYDPEIQRASLESFVFTCVRNQIKDLVKARTRRDQLATEFYLEDALLDGGDFEARHLATDIGEFFAEEVRLPSTLNTEELEVIGLLYVGYRKQAEIADVLGVRRSEVGRLLASVKVKMADWRPSASDAEILQLTFPVQQALEAA